LPFFRRRKKEQWCLTSYRTGISLPFYVRM
jgi:hypothetical protein